MNEDPTSWGGARSGAPLPNPAPGEPTEHPFAVPEAAQYEPAGLLGRGGMGEVRQGRDRRLERDVAIKTARHHDAAAAARLAREAALTARLEHPGIVPVHGAGCLADGRPYYTMPLLRGRSLADALAAAPDLAARLALVRHVLDVAEAVAYAHSQGVLHRDLKPANIMVGGFGETVVADWGLACSREEAAEGAGPGGAVGTPGYMSPEQSRGEPLDPRSDVYGLGAVLYEVIAGRPYLNRQDAKTPSGRAREERSATEDRGKIFKFLSFCPDLGVLAAWRFKKDGSPVRVQKDPLAAAPVELAAVAERALQPDPAARYPGALDLAADLAAWFEGRRVAAYRYSAWELLRRAIRAWRALLAGAALALLALAIAVLVGWTRTTAERDRAQIAEADALAARQRAEHHLALALTAQARHAAAEGRQAEAEVLAAHTLLRGESPEARGVLARYGGRPKASLLSRASLPPCLEAALSPSGARLACASSESVYLLDAATGEALAPPLKRRAHAIAFAGDERTIVLADTDGQLWSWAPPGDLLPILGPPFPTPKLGASAVPGRAAAVGSSKSGAAVIAAGAAWSAQTCALPAMPEAAIVEPDGRLLAACSDRTLVRLAADGSRSVLARLAEEEGEPVALARSTAGPARIAVGTVRGSVLVLAADTGALLRRFPLGPRAVSALALHGPRLAVVLSDDTVVLWDTDTGLALGQLHATRGRPAWLDDGARLRLAGRDLQDWHVPRHVPPHALPLPAGVSALAPSPDGSELAISLGDGSIRVLDLATGAARAVLRWQPSVAKDVAYRPDGRRLAIAVAGMNEQRVYETAGWTVLRAVVEDGFRRVIWADGWLIAGVYGEGMRLWREDTDETLRLGEPAQFREVEVSADGRQVWAFDREDGLWRLAVDPEPRLERLGAIQGGEALIPLGDGALVTTADALVRLDGRGREVARWGVASKPIDLAISPDGRWIAAGHMDGSVTVRRAATGALAARLEGHIARVSAVAFSADSAWLYTGSWDASARAWSLLPLDAPADELRRQAEAGWGRTLEEALAGGL